jgi:hypothetical protein
MKTKKKAPKAQAVTGQTDCFINHEFFQVSEPSNYFPGSGLGQLTAMPTNRQPRFICLKCGKVIQL